MVLQEQLVYLVALDLLDLKVNLVHPDHLVVPDPLAQLVLLDLLAQLDNQVNQDLLGILAAQALSDLKVLKVP